ncbi:MAG TPA: hypothetical protein VNH18_12500 [Bryobacteraceae bacterium]|nr:hypothetical protein [Bryobacteraceae bacterium]
MRLKTVHYQILAWALLILLAAASVYRASSLAISMDESLPPGFSRCGAKLRQPINGGALW